VDVTGNIYLAFLQNELSLLSEGIAGASVTIIPPPPNSPLFLATDVGFRRTTCLAIKISILNLLV
jgi:hypothetical protein